jgi:hypothetical protein
VIDSIEEFLQIKINAPAVTFGDVLSVSKTGEPETGGSVGTRPVCVSCRKLGPYAKTETGVSICEACVKAADAHLQKLAESVPELRDHRLKRWRSGCDCERCAKRRAIV